MKKTKSRASKAENVNQIEDCVPNRIENIRKTLEALEQEEFILHIPLEDNRP